jgi:predicted metal-dependent phosphoesterase TrpH
LLFVLLFTSVFSVLSVVKGFCSFMKFKIDLHVHSKYSTDNDADPEETVQRAIELGLQGIAFTEHYYYGASEPAEALREKYRDSIMILRGVEFSTAEGHCLIFGADTDTMGIKYAPLADVVRFVQKAGGVVIPSHPFRPGTSLGDLVRSIEGITGLEGYNGANMHSYNVKAIEAAKARDLPFTGGSDAHAPREVGSCYTAFDEIVTYSNFIDLLRAGKYRGVDTRKISRMLHFPI